MNCDSYEDLLGDYVDGARASNRPGDDRVAAFERHLAGCARCQKLVADFTNIRAAASTLDQPLPPPRLWARIAASIDGERRRPWWQRAFGGFPAWAPVAAAASLAVLIAGATWMAWTKEPAQAPPQTAGTSAEPGGVAVEQHYAAAIAGLQQVAALQDASLDPDTRAVLTENLAVLDRAISESRAALADEPGNTLAQESLLDALETKVALLQDTVALAADTGNVADARPSPRRN